MPVKPFWLIVALYLIAAKAGAQNLSIDTPAYNDAAKKSISIYNSVASDHSEIYNGVAYHLLPQGTKGSPYFEARPFPASAIIRYNGTWYKDVPVLYDTFADAMVSELRDSLYILRNDKTPDIYLDGHHFIYLTQQKSQNLAPGIYDELYGGRSQVLVKRASSMQSRVGSSVEVFYENKDAIYIKKGNAYHQVNSKGSVLDLFGNKNKELKKYLGEKHIKYRNDKEGSIVKLAGYYDQISN
jgi:hypothetical protein